MTAVTATTTTTATSTTPSIIQFFPMALTFQQKFDNGILA
jgi:hypothetical protein